MGTSHTCLSAFFSIVTFSTTTFVRFQRGFILRAILLAALLLQVSGSQAELAIMAGAKSQADYPHFIKRVSPITTPELSTAGFFVVVSVTRDICLQLEQSNYDLAALAPKGFTISDVSPLVGF